MTGARPPLSTRRIRHYLRTHGYDEGASEDRAHVLFRQHVSDYLQGFLTTAFLCALADELLFQFTKQDPVSLDPQFLNALLAASALSGASTKDAYTRELRVLQQFACAT